MNSFNRFSLLLLVTIIISSVITSCKDDDSPSGPAGALGKQFTTAIPQVTSSLPYSLIVSSDGTQIVASMSYSNNQILYSSDGGSSFAQIYGNTLAPVIVGIDNKGNILSYDNRIFNVGVNNINTYVSAEAYNDQLILGDNGKAFSYDKYSNIIKQRDIASGNFAVVENPVAPTGGSSIHVMKAAGKGLLYLETTTNSNAKAYFLDEATLQWSTPVSINYDYSKLNGCNNLDVYQKFSYVGNNIILAKGCTGSALMDLSTANVTYIEFPDDLIYTDLRDGSIYVDSKKQIYAVAGKYDDLANKSVYRYDGSKWSQLPGSIITGTPLFTTDQVGNIYFNTNDNDGESIKAAVKVNTNTNNKTELKLPATRLSITDASGSGDDHMLIVVDGALYDYDLTASSAKNFGLNNITHINIVSDGRWIAGTADGVYISSDEGKNWTLSTKIFSSVDATRGACSVSESRIINGKLVLIGVYHYYYDNLSLGIRQDKYDDIAIELNGSTSSKLPYQFPGDFLPTAIGPDGVIYGAALFVNEFRTIADRYELKQNVVPARLETTGFSPQLVTDGGLQLVVTAAQSGGVFEIRSRNNDTEEWKSTNTNLPGDFTAPTGYIRQFGDKLVYVHISDAYISGN